MKKCLILLPVAALLLLFLCGASRSKPDYVGTWRLDSENRPIIGQLYTMFGSSLRQFGAEMHIRPDGSFDYHIGLTGGKGSYSVSGDVITATVISWNDPHEETLTLHIIRGDETVALLYPYRDAVFSADILWTQAK